MRHHWRAESHLQPRQREGCSRLLRGPQGNRTHPQSRRQDEVRPAAGKHACRKARSLPPGLGVLGRDALASLLASGPNKAGVRQSLLLPAGKTVLVPSGDQLPEAARCPLHPAGRDGTRGMCRGRVALEPTLLLPPRPAGKGAEDRRQGHCCGMPQSRGPRPVTAEGSHGYSWDQRGGQAQTFSPRLLPERAVWAWSRPGTPFLQRGKTRVEVTGSGCPGPARTHAVRTSGSSRGNSSGPDRAGSPQTGSIWASRHVRSNSAPHSPSFPGPSSPGRTAGVGEGGDGRGWGDGAGGSHLLHTAPHLELACSSYVGRIYTVETLSSAPVVF